MLLIDGQFVVDERQKIPKTELVIIKFPDTFISYQMKIPLGLALKSVTFIVIRHRTKLNHYFSTGKIMTTKTATKSSAKKSTKTTAKTKVKTKTKVKPKSASKTTSAKKASAKAANKSTKSPAAAKVKGATKKATKTAKTSKSNNNGTDNRAVLIQQTAYYIAEKRGFVGGDPVQDWLTAERRVDEMLNENRA